MEKETEELVRQLRRIAGETGHLSTACLGCGYEWGCSVHGCHLIYRAAAQLEAQGKAAETETRERTALVALLRKSEEARTDLGLRLAGAEKELHETKSELERVVQWLSDECICDLCAFRGEIESCERVGGCTDCTNGSCYCKDCREGHSKFALRGWGPDGREAAER